VIVCYKIRQGGASQPEQFVEIKDFGAFRDWLHGPGAGREVTPPDILAYWAVLYRELQEPGFKGARIGLQRAAFGTTVTILGIKR